MSTCGSKTFYLDRHTFCRFETVTVESLKVSLIMDTLWTCNLNKLVVLKIAWQIELQTIQFL